MLIKRGGMSCVPRSRSRICCVPRALLHLCNTEARPNPSNSPGSEPAVQRGTPLTYTHTQTDTTQSLPHIHKMRGISYSVSHVLVVTWMCELISCSSHSAFSDTKYCWFLLVSNSIFKNPLQTGDVYWRISCNELRELSSAKSGV